MTPHESRLQVDRLAELVRLDADTGLLYWRMRSLEFFSYAGDDARRLCSIWNTKYAGQLAFQTTTGAGYLHGSIDNIKFLAHRIVFALHHGHWPVATIDHIDGLKTNNVPSNLRDVSHLNNCRNQRIRTSNTTGFIGVSFDKERGKYEANITINGIKKTLGRFDSPQEAAIARSAADRIHGYHENHGRKQHESA